MGILLLLVEVLVAVGGGVGEGSRIPGVGGVGFLICTGFLVGAAEIVGEGEGSLQTVGCLSLSHKQLVPPDSPLLSSTAVTLLISPLLPRLA